MCAGLAIPATAYAAGMDDMQYYVGTWTCMVGPTGVPASKATGTYTLDGGVLREWVSVPPTGQMTQAYMASSAMTYDAKSGQYVETWLGNMADWSVSSAKPWTGNTEEWADTANNTGKLGRTEVVRTNQNSFTFTSYATQTDTSPNFKGACTRSS
ncbi:MAG TPA: hypothetical protein VFE16_14080 [Candidatus Cybelea sp.]|nr:hypothetical protein [Candidatus Cybelea sp.]